MDKPKQVTDSGHHIWDSMAIEYETGEFLYGVVRALKPKLVVECGTGNGYATEFLLDGLLENDQGGELVTYESADTFRYSTQKRLQESSITFRSGTSEECDLSPDLVFIDCSGSIRAPVIEYWLTHPDRPLTVVHDARREYPFHLGEGVYIPGHDGVWIGRAKSASHE